jgi:hypothetical protein
MNASNQRLTRARGWQGTQQVTTPGAPGQSPTAPGGIMALLAASFDETDTYSIMFSVSGGSVIPSAQASVPVWPPPPGGQPALPVFAQPAGSAVGTRCWAIITWKCEGSQVRRVIDIGSGTTISGTAQAVDVQIQDQTWSVQGHSAVIYSVSAQITKGVRPSSTLPLSNAAQLLPGGNPTFTILAGANLLVPIPTDFGIIGVEVTAVDSGLAPGDTSTIPVWFVVDQNIGASNVKTYAPSLQSGFVKLAPGASSILLVNSTAPAGQQVSGTVTWAIDG